MKSCPREVVSTFKRLTNMSPSEIRAWAKDPRAKRASEPETRNRLPSLADLAEKISRGGSLTKKECDFAKRINSFNSRMGGMRRKHGCKDGIVISLRNWGHQPKACKVPR